MSFQMKVRRWGTERRKTGAREACLRFQLIKCFISLEEASTKVQFLEKELISSKIC